MTIPRPLRPRRSLPLVLAGVLGLAGSAFAGASFKGRSYQSYSYFGRSNADMVVRPDVMTITFDLRKTSDDPAAALDAVQAVATELARRFQTVSPDATVEMHNLTIDSAAEAQKKETANLRSVVVEGSVELPLAAEMDYWKRARLLTQLVAVSKTVVDEQKDAKKAVLAHIGKPNALLRNPESFRADLIKSWIDHVRSFSGAAQSAAAPLEILSCDPPAQVQQHTISLEEVGLSLHINCRIDIQRK